MPDLFQDPSPVVAAALKRFARRGPGTLDLRNLELVAAAESSFTDPNHIAFVIDQLPVTQMQLAVAPVDRAQAEAQFQQILPKFRPVTSRKLLLDLLTTSTVTIVENSPENIVPEAAKDLVRADLWARLKDDPYVLRQRFITPEMITAVVDHVEAEIERGVPATENTSMLSMVFGARAAAVATDTDLLRAWKILERQDVDHRVEGAVLDATEIPRLVELVGDSMVSWFEHRGSDKEGGYGTLLQTHSLSEADAYRLVKMKGVRLRNDLNAIGALRQFHYYRSSELLPPMTPEEVDVRAATTLPSQVLRGDLIAQIRNPEAIDILVGRVSELDYDAIEELIDHVAIESRHVLPILENARRNTDIEQDELDELTVLPIEALDLDDVLLDQLVDRVANRDLQDTALELAALSPTCGPVVFDRILRRQAALDAEPPLFDAGVQKAPRTLLHSVAANSASLHVHRAISEIAQRTNDDSLARSLMSNGSVHVEVWQALKSTFPDLSAEVQGCSSGLFFPTDMHGDLSARSCGYSEIDMKDLIASGDAPPDRVAWLMSNGVSSMESRFSGGTRHLAEAVLSLIEVGHLNDEMLEMTGHPDRHLALEVASKLPPTSDQSRFMLPAVQALQETELVLHEQGVGLPPDKGLRAWSQLPNADSKPLEPSSFNQILEGRVVDGLTLRTPRSRRDVRDLSKYMRNCLDSYVDDVSRGESILAHARTDSDTYAVLWRLRQTSDRDPSEQVGIPVELVLPPSSVEGLPSDTTAVRLHVYEVNSRFNAGEVPESFEAAIRELTEQINDGTIRFPTPSEVAEKASPQRAPEPVRLVRPPRRRAVGNLAVPAEERQPGVEVAPSMLARPAEGETPQATAESLQSELNGGVQLDNPHPASDDLGHDQGLI